MAKQANKKGRTIPALILFVICWYLLDYTGPLIYRSELNPIAAIVWAVMSVAGAIISSKIFRGLANLSQFVATNTVTRTKGTWDFIKHPRQIKHELLGNGWGPFWGAFETRNFLGFKKHTAVVSDFVSNVMILGVPGSGKGACYQVNNIGNNNESKTIISFKGEDACITANMLRERGETVRIVNLGDLWRERLGESDGYNFQDLITDNYTRPGNLLDISDDCNEIGRQLVPPPPEGQKSDNEYFDEGGRDQLSFAMQFESIMKGYEGSFGGVADLIGNKAELLKSAQWVCGHLQNSDGSKAKLPLEDLPWTKLHNPQDVANYISYFKNLAGSVVDLLGEKDSKTGDSFLQTARQALSRFHKATRAYKATSSSSFRFYDQKEGDKPTTVFIVIDASRLESQIEVASLLLWCMLIEWKRHPNKDKPVYLIADEATNFKINGLGSLLTWGRGYGIRLMIFIQSIAAFRKIYGKEDTSTLLGTCEIRVFLPGLSDPDDVKYVKDSLGKKSVIARNRRGNRHDNELDISGIDYREDAIPLMSESEIMTTDKAIVFIRKNPPMLLRPVSYAEIDPIRNQVDENPFHKGKYLKPVKLRLKQK